MNILVTGAAGFIGASLVKQLICMPDVFVTGIDNLNSYYSPKFKEDRLKSIQEHPQFKFIKGDITDEKLINSLFETSHFDIVVNLAAQAGVRYSIENPRAYIQSNIIGFLNILEGCRNFPVKHFLYASSSSVYGDSNSIPYRENDRTDSPVSLYAATKKSDELIAYSYSHLFGIKTTGLRFFTVYGPWGRPDMAPFLFLDAVINHKPIRVFNHGNMKRDFTYIDDVINGICKIIFSTPKQNCEIYNIGHGKPVHLMDFIHIIEKVSGRKANLIMEDMQPGDVSITYADTSKLKTDYDFMPSIDIAEGISMFYEWYKMYKSK